MRLWEICRSNKTIIRLASRNNNGTQQTTLLVTIGRERLSAYQTRAICQIWIVYSLEEWKLECRPLLCTRCTRSMRRGLVKQRRYRRSNPETTRLYVIDYSNATTMSRFLRIEFLYNDVKMWIVTMQSAVIFWFNSA